MTPYRITFWQIENAWFFYVLAALAAGIFLAGMATHICVWKKSARSLEVPFSWEALKRTILDTLLGRSVLHGEGHYLYSFFPGHGGGGDHAPGGDYMGTHP